MERDLYVCFLLVLTSFKTYDVVSEPMNALKDARVCSNKCVLTARGLMSLWKT